MKKLSWIAKTLSLLALAVGAAVAFSDDARSAVCWTVLDPDSSCDCTCQVNREGGVFCERFEDWPDPVCYKCAYGPCQFNN
jgi:hypothetical protein